MTFVTNKSRSEWLQCRQMLAVEGCHLGGVDIAPPLALVVDSKRHSKTAPFSHHDVFQAAYRNTLFQEDHVLLVALVDL